MGEIRGHKPVKLICSIIFRSEEGLDKAEVLLKKSYGPIEEEALTMPFDYTDYYYGEMGSPLFRRLICFKRPVSLERIRGVKIKTNAFEDRLREGGKRTVNIDPGYITEAKLVLLTTKDYSHRIYVGSGIFAETTLYFRGGDFRAWPWTYPDYASKELRGYFRKVRVIYTAAASPARNG